jgi:hypothetical protein
MNKNMWNFVPLLIWELAIIAFYSFSPQGKLSSDAVTGLMVVGGVGFGWLGCVMCDDE